MRIGIHSALTNSQSVRAVIDEIRKTAEYGISSYWAPMLGGQDTLTVLALAGREVPVVELGTAVVPMPVRTPFALAQQVSTVNEALGPGRLTLGLGTSHSEMARDLFKVEWPDKPVQAARKYVQALFAELDLRLSGDPSEKAAARTPVLLGAVNPVMAALAAEVVSGVVTWAAGELTIRDVLMAAVKERGRSQPFRVVAALPVCVTDDPAGMRDLIRARLGANDRFPSYQRVLAREGVTGLAELSLVGSADDVSRRLDTFAASGVSDFAAHIIGNTAARDATWDFLAAHAQQ